jgi:hypothetical protein
MLFLVVSCYPRWLDRIVEAAVLKNIAEPAQVTAIAAHLSAHFEVRAGAIRPWFLYRNFS